MSKIPLRWILTTPPQKKTQKKNDVVCLLTKYCKAKQTLQNSHKNRQHENLELIEEEKQLIGEFTISI